MTRREFERVCIVKECEAGEMRTSFVPFPSTDFDPDTVEVSVLLDGGVDGGVCVFYRLCLSMRLISCVLFAQSKSLKTCLRRRTSIARSWWPRR